jgi:hypothetical protein
MTAAASGASAQRDGDLRPHFELRPNLTEMIGIFRELFRRPEPDETVLTKMKPFSVFGASRAKPPMVISFITTTAHRRPGN